jgi:molecular chaperone HtpG
LSESDAETARLVGAQVLDNALLSAGLLDDPQRIVTRTEQIMARLLGR